MAAPTHDQKPRKGSLEVITGCMFSGKTEELIRRLERARIAGRSFLVFKPTPDTRYARHSVVTHFGRSFESHLLEPGFETIESLVAAASPQELDGADLIAFDEGSFFSDKLPGLCESLISLGKRVIVAGLDLTFAEEPFGSMPTLLAKADRVDKLAAVCVRCGASATRSQRLVNGEPATGEGPIIQVGGAEAYEARCRDCYVHPNAYRE